MCGGYFYSCKPLLGQFFCQRLADYRWSSYHVYGYGKKQPDWLKTDFIFSFFDGDHEKQIQEYRKKVQFYSLEEKKLWEDFRHGLFFGTLEFVDKMKRAHLPDTPHKEQPQHLDSLRSADPHVIIKKAAAILDCDPEEFVTSGRMYGTAKINRDLLMYFIWEYGVYTNEEIGNLFHVTYSTVSRNVSSFKVKLSDDKILKKLYNEIKSQSRCDTICTYKNLGQKEKIRKVSPELCCFTLLRTQNSRVITRLFVHIIIVLFPFA